MMRVSNSNNDTLQASKQKDNKEKKVNPKVFQAMENYEKLKQQLYLHFFEVKPLNISNKQFSLAYADLYNLLNDSNFVVTNVKQQFESIQQSFLNVYKRDLGSFSGRVYEHIKKYRGLQPQDQIQQIARWINTYARFNHWIFKMFMIIERNAMMAQGVKLYFEGIKILKEQLVDKIYDDLYRIVYQALELYKSDRLRALEPLQLVIRYIGIVGFTKLKLVQMVKTTDNRFQYQSKKDNAQPSENPFQTGYFKTNFIFRLVKDLKSKYSELVAGMIQLSTPQYFEKAKHYIQKEEDTADHFYGHHSIKETVIRSVLETLIVERAEGLLRNPKSGLVHMMQEKDVKNLVKVYEILKKANMQRVFFKEFQGYIQNEGEQILSKISAEDQRAMKKETIQMVFKDIIDFNHLIDTIRSEIDINDAQLQKAQNTGFQSFCNVGNKVCNYLAYYADLMLKKEAGGCKIGQEIVVEVGKISKYLYSYDYFMNMYQKLLGLRILYDGFKNQEAQFSLINMFKNEAGLNATSKICNMIQDQKSSEGWNVDFQLRNKFGFGLDVMMLTSGSWQINDPKCGQTHVPPELLPAVREFQEKFHEKMPNRSVSWIFTHGRGVVQFIPNSNIKHILLLNNYQLLVLLYLKRHEYSPAKYCELVSELKIQDEPFFKSSILSLLKHTVLVKKGTPVKIESKNDELHLNFDFKPKNQKVSCSILPRYTEKNANTSAPVSAERCILIDAALVKIMKQRRRAPYQEVILQVQKMCRTFKAEISQIKLRIQNCQQRQFLERDPNDMNILIYKP